MIVGDPLSITSPEPAVERARPLLAVLGPLLVRTSTTEVTPRASRQRRLLTILAAAASSDHLLTVDELVEALYGLDGSPRTRHSLASELWRARQVLGAKSISTERDGYRLDLSHCDVDVVSFESELAEGRSLLHAGQFAEAEAALAGALALWRGEPLAEWRDRPLGKAAVARLAELRTGGTVDYAEALIGAGRHERAIELLDSLTAAEPTREHAWALLVEACLQADRLRHARAAFDTARRTLAEYGLDLGAELQAVGERVLAGVTLGEVPSDQLDRADQLPPLSGREQELSTLRDMVAALGRQPRSTLLQVAGEPGIGKSRLLRELRVIAHDRGCLVLGGRAAEFEGELPFGVFRDALDDWTRALSPESRERLAGEAGSEVANVLEGFDRSGPADEPELGEERYRAHQAVRRLLSAAAREAPLVLILDDVQWADPGSIELLRYLHVHPPRGPVLIAVGFRAEHLPDSLTHAFASAVRQEDAVRLDLAPITKAAAATLLGSDMADGLLDHCYQQSGGNPFLLLTLSRGATHGTPPPTLHTALQSELFALSPDARSLLRGAAVTGDPFEWTTAAHAADIGEHEALPALDELLQFGLVSSTDAFGHYAFRHPVVRASVYESAPTSWRMSAHGRVAAALEAAGCDPAERAPHVERSARRGDTTAARLLTEAGQASERRAPALAARWYAAALRLLGDGRQREAQRIALMMALATALAACGRLRDSVQVLSELLERMPDTDENRVGLLAACASAENLLGQHRNADARLQAAYRIAPRDSPGAVALALELGTTAGFENRAQQMAEWAERAVERSTAGGMRATVTAAVGQLALAQYFLGRSASQAADQAGQQLDDLADDELATRLDLGLWVGWTEAVLERHQRSIDHCQRVIDVSRATGQGATLLVTMSAQAWAQMYAGRLADATATLTAAIEVGRLSPHLFFVTTLGLAAQVATARGDYQAALRAGEECVELARSADPGLIPGMSGLYLATPLIEQGEAQAARDILLEMSGGKHELDTSRSGHTAAFEILTRAEIALGRLDAAESWARRAQAATFGYQLPREAAFAHRAVARVALARGDAAGSARTALAAAEAAPHAPIEAARCRLLAGQALARAGERHRAIQALERAAEELAQVGATGYAAEADEALRQLGRPVPLAAAPPPAQPLSVG